MGFFFHLKEKIDTAKKSSYTLPNNTITTLINVKPE